MIYAGILCPLRGLSQESNAQYSGFFEKVLAGNLCADDFTDSIVFLTLDTINTYDVNAPSTFIETKNPNEIIRSFKNFLTTFKHDGQLFFYGELIKSIFHDNRNVIMCSLNTSTNTYRLNLWMDKNRPSLIEGVTVGKYLTRVEPRGDIIKLRP